MNISSSSSNLRDAFAGSSSSSTTVSEDRFCLGGGVCDVMRRRDVGNAARRGSGPLILEDEEADPCGTKSVESGAIIGSEGTGSVEVSLLGTICESSVVESTEGTSPTLSSAIGW